MNEKTLSLTNKISKAIAEGYLYVDGEMSALDYLDVKEGVSKALDDDSYEGLSDENLIQNLENKGVFYLPVNQSENNIPFVSAYVGEILRTGDTSNGPYFLCTTKGVVDGVDFYDAQKNNLPTVVVKYDGRILIDDDSLKHVAKIMSTDESDVSADQLVDRIVNSDFANYKEIITPIYDALLEK